MRTARSCERSLAATWSSSASSTRTRGAPHRPRTRPSASRQAKRANARRTILRPKPGPAHNGKARPGPQWESPARPTIGKPGPAHNGKARPISSRWPRPLRASARRIGCGPPRTLRRIRCRRRLARRARVVRACVAHARQHVVTRRRRRRRRGQCALPAVVTWARPFGWVWFSCRCRFACVVLTNSRSMEGIDGILGFGAARRCSASGD
jgi:hypothetical protein